MADVTKLSRRQNSMKFSRADSRVKVWFPSVSGTDSVAVRTPRPQFWFYQTTSSTLKMGKESVPETSGKLHILTRLSAQKISLNK